MGPRNVQQAVLDIQARRDAIFRYATAHDKFSEEEQLLRAEGKEPEADGAKQYAEWALRAYRAELKQSGTPYYYDPHDRGTP